MYRPRWSVKDAAVAVFGQFRTDVSVETRLERLSGAVPPIYELSARRRDAVALAPLSTPTDVSAKPSLVTISGAISRMYRTRGVQ